MRKGVGASFEGGGVSARECVCSTEGWCVVLWVAMKVGGWVDVLREKGRERE